MISLFVTRTLVFSEARSLKKCPRSGEQSAGTGRHPTAQRTEASGASGVGRGA